MDAQHSPRTQRTAFLLSQLGALASARFAEHTRKLDLSPSEAGVLRVLGRTPGVSQRSLADRLGAVPSRVVPLIDSLEARGLVERVRSSHDRRNYELRLTARGRTLLEDLRAVAEQHEAELLAPLTPDQAAQLGDLLSQLAAAHSLDTDLHRDSAAR